MKIKNEIGLDQILKREKELKRELLMLELKKEEIAFKTKKNLILKELRKNSPDLENKIIVNNGYKKSVKTCKYCDGKILKTKNYKKRVYCSISCKRKHHYYKIEKPARDLKYK